eukprot:scaffold4676_cov164-Amphora_coffeaeformis.AAC.1
MQSETAVWYGRAPGYVDIRKEDMISHHNLSRSHRDGACGGESFAEEKFGPILQRRARVCARLAAIQRLSRRSTVFQQNARFRRRLLRQRKNNYYHALDPIQEVKNEGAALVVIPTMRRDVPVVVVDEGTRPIVLQDDSWVDSSDSETEINNNNTLYVRSDDDDDDDDDNNNGNDEPSSSSSSDDDHSDADDDDDDGVATGDDDLVYSSDSDNLLYISSDDDDDDDDETSSSSHDADDNLVGLCLDATDPDRGGGDAAVDPIDASSNDGSSVVVSSVHGDDEASSDDGWDDEASSDGSSVNGNDTVDHTTDDGHGSVDDLPVEEEAVVDDPVVTFVPRRSARIAARRARTQSVTRVPCRRSARLAVKPKVDYSIFF